MLLEMMASTTGVAVLSLATVLVVATAQSTNVQPAPAEKLAPCPDSPNCVSTLATDEQHGIEPLAYTGTTADAKQRIRAIVNDMPRTKLEADDGNYLHFTFRSLIFRFVDDVEFVFDDQAKLIHFRSASRKGYGDMGVNRKRMEKIRSHFIEATAQP